MQYKIHGNTMQTVDILLNQGEAIFAVSGGLAWMRGDVRLEIVKSEGGIKGLTKKGSTKGTYIYYTCFSPKSLLVFSPEVPGTIHDVVITETQSVICNRSSLLCADASVITNPFFQQKLTTSMGSEEYILDELTGKGTAFLQIPGEARQYELRQGEVMKVDPDHLAAFESTVRFDLNIDEIVWAILVGPGRIWLQTLSMLGIATAFSRYK